LLSETLSSTLNVLDQQQFQKVEVGSDSVKASPEGLSYLIHAI